MYFLDSKSQFPDPATADDEGLIAIGGDLSVNRLLEAYYAGIFPWYDELNPILWWSPNPRMVLFPDKLKVSKSMKQLFNQNKFEVTYNQNFDQVIKNCASISRKDQHGTWITEDIIAAYNELHKLGLAQSVEVWKNKKLVGGLYGVYLKDKKVFCGESMFSYQSNASKYGFITLVRKLIEEEVKIIDCQVYTKHLASLGAEEMPRNQFLDYLK